MNTPFSPLMRSKAIGVDCAGLIIGVLTELGLLDYDDRQYGPAVGLERLTAALARFCDRVDGEPQGGDFLVFSLRGGQPHCGISSGEGTMLHSWDLPGVMKVVEMPLDRWWRAHIAAVYRWREDAAGN